MGLSLTLSCFHLFQCVMLGLMKEVMSCFSFFFCYSQVFLNLEFFVPPWKQLHTDILIKSECVFLSSFLFFYSSGELTRGFRAALYGRISLLKCDKEWLWIPELVWYPHFYCFLAFLWPGTRLGPRSHFRVFPTSSDQFKVISARSGSQDVKEGRKKRKEKHRGGVV